MPGLEQASPDAPLLVSEIILPRLNEWPRYQRRLARQMDPAMMAIHGAQERTRAEFEALLRKLILDTRSGMSLTMVHSECWRYT